MKDLLHSFHYFPKSQVLDYTQVLKPPCTVCKPQEPTFICGIYSFSLHFSSSSLNIFQFVLSLSFESWIIIVVINHLKNARVNLKCSVYLGVSQNGYQSILNIILFYYRPNKWNGSLAILIKFSVQGFFERQRKEGEAVTSFINSFLFFYF